MDEEWTSRRLETEAETAEVEELAELRGMDSVSSSGLALYWQSLNVRGKI